MVSNQVLGARLVAGLLTLSLPLGGCALFHHSAPAQAAPPARPVEVGWLSVYQRLVRPLPEGAVLRPRREAP